MAATIDQLKSRFLQEGQPLAADANLEELLKQSKDYHKALGNLYTGTQLDILTLEYASYLVARALSDVKGLDPKYYLDTYNMVLSQINAANNINAKTDGQDKAGIITIGKMERCPDFNGKIRKWK